MVRQMVLPLRNRIYLTIHFIYLFSFCISIYCIFSSCISIPSLFTVYFLPALVSLRCLPYIFFLRRLPFAAFGNSSWTYTN